MAVAFDAVGTDVTSNGVATKDLTALTVGTGSERALVVQICWSVAAPTGITVIWDPTPGTNQSCTAITGSNAANGSNCNVAQYGLVAPTSGNKTLRVSWTGNRDVYLQAVAWTGVDQTGGATSFPNGTGATGTSTTAASTVTSAVNDAVMAVHVTNTAGVLSVNNIQTFKNLTATLISGAGNRADGASSVLMTAALDASGIWASCGTSVKASAGATNTIMFADQARLGG